VFYLKGSVARDFLLQFFSRIVFPQASENIDHFERLRKFEIFACQGKPPVSTTQATNLPPLSNNITGQLPRVLPT
jgi:hypothetical protein